MNGALTITFEADELMEEILVPALPPIGTVMSLGNKGTYKVKTIEFRAAGAGEPMKVVVEGVPILHF